MNNRLNPNNSNPVSQATLTARGLVESARHEARQILIRAQAEAADILREAETNWALIEQHRKLAQKISWIGVWKRAVIKAKEDLLLVTESLAKSILLAELSSSPESILNRIEAVAEILNDLTTTILEISEGDSSLLTESFSENNYNIKLKLSTSLKSGDFVLRSKNYTIKSSPVFQLESLLKEFNKSGSTFKQFARGYLSNGDSYDSD